MNFIYKNEFIKYQQDNLLNSINQTESLRNNSKQTLIQNLLKTDNSKILTKDSISIKPDFSSIYLNDRSLIDNYTENISINNNKDSLCYIIKNEQNIEIKPVYFTKTEITKSNVNIYSLKEKVNDNNDWLLIPLLLGGVLFVSATILYRKYLGLFFEGLIYGNQSNRIINEKNTHTKRLSWILDIIFIISLSVFVDQLFRKLNIYSPPHNFPFLIFLLSFVFLVLQKIYYWIVYKLSAVFSNQKKFISELFDSSSLYTRCLGFFLLPLVFLISYSTSFLPSVFIYFSSFIIVIALIYRTIRMIRLFMGSGFSIFYFILYLCALEIAPLLLAYKEVISLSKES